MDLQNQTFELLEQTASNWTVNKLPPCWFDVEITLKNGKKYKSMLASINNWGGVQFVINQTFKKRIYLDTDEVVSWEFV